MIGVDTNIPARYIVQDCPELAEAAVRLIVATTVRLASLAVRR